MKAGFLSHYFDSIAAKRLTAVEVNKKISNQHEFNGTKALRNILGTNDNGDTIYFKTKFIWLGSKEESVSADGVMSWYDSRFKKEDRSAEFRLYFPSTDVTDLGKPGDLLIIAKRSDDSILSLIVEAGSTYENQLIWLFNTPVQSGSSFIYHDFKDNNDKEIDFSTRFILEELEIEVSEIEESFLDSILERFKGVFPKTKDFSILARQFATDISALEDPDHALISWMNLEEKLFRRLEHRIVDERLKEGFLKDSGTDVDGFIDFSLSVQNRRKARAGLALEHHLEEIFFLNGIKFSRYSETENRNKPDFLFPSSEDYHNASFPKESLTMLGVKTTCKERWRQVLSEALKIEEKHLFTLEPSISVNQTDEMRAKHLQLVIPKSIHITYNESQRSWLLDIRNFIKLVSKKQRVQL